MAGIVYLKTNRFEVKLEGITFKAKEFESLFTADILFPEGKIWAQPPVVGLDVMRHPRDPKIILVLLCFGVGCLILRFHSGEQLPDPVLKFLTDTRIRFVGFAIPEKQDLFPFEELGLTKDKVDIGYLATKFFNDPKYKRYELGDLARKVLGIKRMIGLTQASSFERHEQIKCAICQLFISSVIAMSLFTTKDKKKLAEAPKRSSFLKNLSLPLLTEGWFKLPKVKKGDKFQPVQTGMDNLVQTADDENFLVDIVHSAPEHEEVSIGYDLIHAKVTEDIFCDDIDGVWGGNKCATADDHVQVKCSEVYLDDLSPRVRGGEVDYGDDFVRAKVSEDKLGDGSAYDKAKEVTINKDEKKETAKGEEVNAYDDSKKEAVCLKKKPLKGILKCPSSNLDSWNASSSKPDSPVSMDKDEQSVRGSLRRANSKGFNVKFK
ncbi:PREDICTED: uncharacterized protein LOC109226521 [Nicotiana attenuata]|uniref:Uncharacterized protein n=1 Tax=Nicotiana attenuata TaxID=49451 RepID=A0A1J6IAZ2_NICAT|nr:PREDICTED: uncharacterized protein LOC109226521 [Nicotiana attenuata]OIT01612.1 hypothetical protein A4A49_38878 [Nicotiana attenuata]